MKNSKRLMMSGFTGMLLATITSVTADIKSDADTVLNWAETSFSQTLSPTQPTSTAGDWLYRSYPAADLLVGVYQPDNGVYYITGSALVRGDKPIYYDTVTNILKTVNPKPDNFQTLIGKWLLLSSGYEITKQDGSIVETYTDHRPKNITWEFFSDGRLVAQQDGQTQENRWSLNAIKLNGNAIEYGKLTLTGGNSEQLATSFGLTELVYTMSAGSVFGGSGKYPIMDLSIDVTKIGPYKKNILKMSFQIKI